MGIKCEAGFCNISSERKASMLLAGRYTTSEQDLEACITQSKAAYV